ncbi:MAG: amidohydrolase family protein [Planctomycetes bacterium]|nr:amidohydrolase family protein [Planctomycetota bacterium]
MPLLALLATLVLQSPAPVSAPAASPRTIAYRAAKVLTCERHGPGFLDHALVLVKDGRVEKVLPARDATVPSGYQIVDLGARWIMPGMIDLHSHLGGSSGDINDMVLQLNTGLRVSSTVVPRNPALQRILEAGVTTVLFIPGSGTNISGAGILLKTSPSRFEEMKVRDPGSLKIAQGDNPTRWAYGMGRGMMNYHIRGELARGMHYAKERAADPARERDPRFDVFEDLAAKRTQVSTHTQLYQLVMQSLRIIRGEFGIDVYIDHGEWKGYLATEQALALGVATISGPREIDVPGGHGLDTDGRIVGIAGEYQKRGMELVGFNTDAPVVPGEELPLQAAVSARYGFDASELQGVKGLTIVPAIVAGIEKRVGSLEPGKDADFLVLDGDPLDPRTRIEQVFVEGARVFDQRAR